MANELKEIREMIVHLHADVIDMKSVVQTNMALLTKVLIWLEHDNDEDVKNEVMRTLMQMEIQNEKYLKGILEKKYGTVKGRKKSS